jgi:phage terminase small subunit
MGGMMSKLTLKQDAFVKEYILNGGNATKAAIDAGYKVENAKQIGSENLTKLDIKKAIEKHQKKQEEVFLMSKTDKLKVLERIINATASKDGEKGVLNASAAIAAIKEHNLMQGHNAPTETNANIKVEQSLKERLTGGSKR